jgi:CheY-like chemotaxis protein
VCFHKTCHGLVIGMAKILHIDDEDVWLVIVRRALADHHLDSADSYNEALRYLSVGAPYDLALVDYNLTGGRDGLGGELLDLLRSQHGSTKRIVVTGSPPSGSLRATIFERFEVEEVIIKGDLTVPDLRRVVEYALRSPAGQDHYAKFRRSVGQRYRDWQARVSDRVDAMVQDKEAYLENAARLNRQSGRRAQQVLDGARARKALFLEQCVRMERTIDGINDVHDAVLAADELERLETQFKDLDPDDHGSQE